MVQPQEVSSPGTQEVRLVAAVLHCRTRKGSFLELTCLFAGFPTNKWSSPKQGSLFLAGSLSRDFDEKAYS